MFTVATTDITFQVIMVIFAVIIAYLLANYYYFKKKPRKPLNEGLAYGIVMAIVSFVIEAIVMVYGFASAQGWDYFMTWNIILGYTLVIIIPVLVAYKK